MFGIGMTLAVLPVVSAIAFALLAANPVFLVIAVFQVLRRGLAYGLTKPASDMLYSVVSREAKYKAKNFVETAVWRGGDVLSTWTIRSSTPSARNRSRNSTNREGSTRLSPAARQAIRPRSRRPPSIRK